MTKMRRPYKLKDGIETFDLDGVANRLDRYGRMFSVFVGTDPQLIAEMLRDLWDAGEEMMHKWSNVKGAYDIAKAEYAVRLKEATNIASRINMAIEDMDREGLKPHALLIHPRQWVALRALVRSNALLGHGFLTTDSLPMRGMKFEGLEIYIARHVVGPLVMTERGLVELRTAFYDMEQR